ncbi:hypothetical protein ABZP36_028261 [Zizania latifolia]
MRCRCHRRIKYRVLVWQGRSTAVAVGINGFPDQELLTKMPAQSWTSIVYKFTTDDILQEQYRDPWNEVHIEKLLEDLDALAGTIVVKVP